MNSGTENRIEKVKGFLSTVDKIQIISPDNYLDKIVFEKERIRNEEKALNNSKFFWEKEERVESFQLSEFSKFQVSTELKKRINKIQESNPGTYVWDEADRLALENSLYFDWIKSTEIVNQQNNLALIGIKEGVIAMAEEFQELKENLRNKDNLLLEGDRCLKESLKRLEELENSKILSEFQIDQEAIKALGDNANDLQVKILLLQSEGSRLLRELDNSKSQREREKDYFSLKIANKELTLKENEVKIRALEKQVDKYQLALEDAAKQIADFESSAKKFEKLYREKVSELTEISSQRTFSFLFNNKYTTVTNLLKTSLVLFILTNIVFLFRKLIKFLKFLKNWW